MSQTAATQPFTAAIVWGEASTRKDNPSVCVYPFGTQGELDAFLEGIDASSGWSDYEQQDLENPAPDGTFAAAIIWGEEPTRWENPQPCRYRFPTEAELEAFLKGVDEASGWSSYLPYEGLCSDCAAQTPPDRVSFPADGSDRFLCPACTTTPATPPEPMTNAQYVACAGNRCPACGADGEHMDLGPAQFDGNYGWREARCGVCQARWNDVYTLTGYDGLER